MSPRRACVLFFLLTTFSDTAVAQDTTDAPGDPDVDTSPDTDPRSDGELEAEARARFSLGQLYYSQARFEEAAIEFEAAYTLHPHPFLLHDIYLARRDLGDLRGAADALARYLAAATDLEASERRLLDGRLAALRRQLETMPAVAEVAAPPDPVVGDSAPRELGERILDPAEPRAAALATPERPRRNDDGLLAGGIAAFSIGGAAIVMMAITGPLALSDRDAAASRCAPTCNDDELSSARSLGIATDVGLGLALAGAATGTLLFVLATSGDHGTDEMTVLPSVSPDQAAIVVGGRF